MSAIASIEIAGGVGVLTIDSPPLNALGVRGGKTYVAAEAQITCLNGSNVK